MKPPQGHEAKVFANLKRFKNDVDMSTNGQGDTSHRVSKAQGYLHDTFISTLFALFLEAFLQFFFTSFSF